MTLVMIKRSGLANVKLHTQRAPVSLPFPALQNTINEKIKEAINNAALQFDSNLIHSFAGSHQDGVKRIRFSISLIFKDSKNTHSNNFLAEIR
jgi:hypothetical protein